MPCVGEQTAAGSARAASEEVVPGKKEPEDIQIVARNRRATYLYEIIEKIEAGLALVGSEVKSVRAGKVSMSDAYATPRGNEIFLVNLNIAAYEKATIERHDPLRARKLLLHRRQIHRLLVKIKERGLTLIPLQVYFRNGVAKVEIGLARGKHKFDKRESIARKDQRREMERMVSRTGRE
ncbi:MAG: SsrA-binding protein SmpB [Candidatus Eisenbacteria bacterium]|nr:SsrA-binding protein SmpB [Candidatus Eisenbacteria bacterium]